MPDKYMTRRTKWHDYVVAAKVEGHSVGAEMDYRKMFASRPGSADWKAHCECGWSSSGWHYGEWEAIASAYPHIREKEKEKQS